MTSTFLGQGTYGCIYKQKLRCANEKAGSIKKHKKLRLLKDKNVLSKIYMDKRYATRELEIGKQVVKIPNYEKYYSPLLDSCNVSLAQINHDDIDKCDLIDQMTVEKDQSEYFTTMTKYIKGQTLTNYIDASQTRPLNNKMFYIYTCLIKSVELLNAHGIVHFDLSERNIIVDTTDRPIIIDYGMSIEINKVKTAEQYKYEFGHYSYLKVPEEPSVLKTLKVPGGETNSFSSENQVDFYEPWCIEIIFLMHLNQETNETNFLVDDQDIKTLINLSDQYIDLLNLEEMYFTKDEIAKHKESKIKLCESFKGKTAHTVSEELLKTHNKWDIYAITIICMKYLSESAITTQKTQKIIELMKSRILF